MKRYSVAGCFISTVRFTGLILLVALMFPLSAFCSSDKLVDSDDYKGKEFIKGCISDYTDMVKGDNIDWVWVAPGVKLEDYSISINKFENKSDEIRSAQAEDIKTVFKEILGKLKGGKEPLSATMCIYEIQKFSPGKAWIPFAGGSLMQAGVGVEMILSHKGKVVAKIRHFDRNGSRLEDAADENASHLKRYISNH